MNAKREHLRARIETCLGLQAKFGLLCETCSRLVLALSKRSYFLRFQIYGLKKYYLWKLELCTLNVNLPIQSINDNRNTKHSNRECVTCEIGYYRHHIDRNGELLLQETEYTRLMHKMDELREAFEKVHGRVHQELRKLMISLQSDFDEIKRKLLLN